MKEGDKVRVLHSAYLEDLGSAEMAGMDAVIVEVRTKGCWLALLGETFQGEKEWFLTFDSII